AACMLHEPRLLLLDEPTAGVDPQARRDFWERIHQLAATGITVLVSTHYMDEAERCDRIVYLAFGHILAHGTVEEVVSGAGLVTWIATGKGVRALSAVLNRQQHVQATVFGASLHVSATDAERLAAAIAPWRDDPELRWEESEPSLEDVFIHLMAPRGGRS
ncbi:MAG: AAA family ATPase, partial [Rhizobiales bacterium]|nr:AAA family ATPase [Hyphomicrobiales bacterium]